MAFEADRAVSDYEQRLIAIIEARRDAYKGLGNGWHLPLNVVLDDIRNGEARKR